MSATDVFSEAVTNAEILDGPSYGFLIEIIETNSPLKNDLAEAGIVLEKMDELLQFMMAAFEGISTSAASCANNQEQIFAGATSIMSIMVLLNRRLGQFNRARLHDRLECVHKTCRKGTPSARPDAAGTGQ